MTLLKVDDDLLSLWDAPVEHAGTEMGRLTHERHACPRRACEEWVRAFAGLVAENRDYLTDLDAAIGDADHGSNMDRGMRAAVAALDEIKPATAVGAVHQGRHDPGLHRRRRQRAAVRHLLPRIGASLGDADTGLA